MSSIQLMGATTYMIEYSNIVIDTITTDIFAILSCGTVGDGQTTADEVILYINYDDCTSWLDNLIQILLLLLQSWTYLTFLIHPFQQKTNSCILMLPSPDTLKIMNKSVIC